VRLFGAQETNGWDQISLSTGHLLLRPDPDCVVSDSALAAQLEGGDTAARVSSSDGIAAHMKQERCHRESSGTPLLPSYGISSIFSPEEVVNRMRQTCTARSPSLLSSTTIPSSSSLEKSASKRSSALRQDSYKRLDEMVQRQGVNSLPGQQHDDMGLDALLRFMPAFVRSNCLSGYNASTLMDHRVVTILFIIADMKVGVANAVCRQPPLCSLL
jgi:hypothetical protein